MGQEPDRVAQILLKPETEASAGLAEPVVPDGPCGETDAAGGVYW